uniref:ENT domain-containing protein n=1 Tax=Davidia involucrata TaxID=16924 RepID=A0A5B6ZLC0_DAVIN
MDYDLADSSGTDDDLLPSHNNRVPRGSRVAVNGRSVVGSVPYHRMHSDMESQIHHLEQEAYGSVLLAFKAQSDALTWEKEGLITELRKELRVSDDEHRELLTRVNADDVIRRIREWRQVGGHHGSMLSTPQPVHGLIPSPTVSASRKKQKTSQSVPLSFSMASQALPPQSIAASVQPSSSAVKRGPTFGARGKKPKHGQPLPGLSSMQSMSYASTAPTGRGQFTNRGSSGAVATKEPAEAATRDPLIGRKVMKRWPDDNNFYEAVINDYDPVKGVHALVYDIYTVNEAWEWVDLKKDEQKLSNGKNLKKSRNHQSR